MLPGSERQQLLDVGASVSGVVDQNRAVEKSGVNIVTVVKAPAAAPHRLPSVVSLDDRVRQQTRTIRKHLDWSVYDKSVCLFSCEDVVCISL